MGIAFVTAADRGKFDDGRAWGNCWYFEDYRDDSGNHIGYKPCKSPATPEVVEQLLKSGVGMFELFHKPRPNRSGKAISTVVRAVPLKALDLFSQIDLSKVPDQQDAVFIIAADRGKLQDGTLWRNAYGLQPYREDTADSMGFKPMKFDLAKELEESMIQRGIGFYGCEYDTRPATNAQGVVESLLILAKADLIKSFDMFGWLDSQKVPAATIVKPGKASDDKAAA